MFDVVAGQTGRAVELVDTQSDRDGGAAVALFERGFDQLAQQPHPVLQRSTIFVGAVVVARRQEMLCAAEIMSGVDIHQIEAGLQGSPDRRAVPPAKVGDIGLRHAARLDRMVGQDRQIRRAQRGLPGSQVGGRHPVVGEFNAGKGTAGVD